MSGYDETESITERIYCIKDHIKMIDEVLDSNYSDQFKQEFQEGAEEKLLSLLSKLCKIVKIDAILGKIDCDQIDEVLFKLSELYDDYRSITSNFRGKFLLETLRSLGVFKNSIRLSQI